MEYNVSKVFKDWNDSLEGVISITGRLFQLTDSQGKDNWQFEALLDGC